MGGEDVKKRNCINTHKKYMPGKKILIIPWSSSDINKTGIYRNIMKEYFTYCGAKEVKFLERRDKEKEIKQKIKNSQIIYLPGGYTDDLIRNVKRRKYLPKILENYNGIISGNSAGANAIAEKYVNYAGQKYSIKKGLGLLKTTIIVHYDETKEKKIREMELRRKIKIKRISEKDALII